MFTTSRGGILSGMPAQNNSNRTLATLILKKAEILFGMKLLLHMSWAPYQPLHPSLHCTGPRRKGRRSNSPQTLTLCRQAQRCSSIASSAGAEVEAKGEAEGHHKSPRTQDGSDSGRVSSEKAAFLPPLRPLTGDLEEPPRRKHGKYVSKFREHILEERRVWMEVGKSTRVG